MAVRRRLRGELQPDRAVGPGAIVGDGLLPEGFAELLGDIPPGDVGRRAGRKRDDDPQRLGWIRLRRGKTGDGKQDGRDRAHDPDTSVHTPSSRGP